MVVFAKVVSTFLSVFAANSSLLLLLFLTACGGNDELQPQTEIVSEASENSVSDAPENNVSNAAAAPSANQRAKRGKETSHLLLGTGSVQGVYFPIGGVICRLLNRSKASHSIRCSLESTGGSIYNLRELREGNFDLVFAQSDWQFHAYHGTSTFKNEGANPALRAVFALEADPLALLVKSDSEIHGFNDLENRSVSFGYTRSLQHRIIDDLLAAKGWDDGNFKIVRRMGDKKQLGELCGDRVEAILLLASSLTDHLRNLDQECKLRLVPIEGPEIDQIIVENPYYRTGKIPSGVYVDSQQDVMSFGLGATFVASESSSPKAIYHVVKEIVENFKDFQSLHPSLETIKKGDLPYAGISAPLHPGAIRYYKEVRLLK